jgi:hypothetical protein
VTVLKGQFIGTDKNKDGIITLKEVNQNNFQATIPPFDQITVKEKKRFESFEYTIGTNDLEFIVRTTGRGGGPLFPQDVRYEVDFSEEFDHYLIQDLILLGFDSEETGTVRSKTGPNQPIPEPSLFLGSGLAALGIIKRSRFLTK